MNRPTEKTSDSTKLVSLLALAASAAAMPQTSNADVIFHSANAHVGYGGGDSTGFSLTLSGTAQFGFQTVTPPATTINFGLTSTQHRSIRAMGGANAGVQGVGGVAAPRSNAGEAWNQGSLSVYLNIAVAKETHFKTADMSSSARSPTSGYDPAYLAFQFDDNGTRYGWIQVGLSIGGPGPSLTIYGYAYDTTGAQLPMGVTIPEPAPTAILALGALTLGAKGLRLWRRQRGAAVKS